MLSLLGPLCIATAILGCFIVAQGMRSTDRAVSPASSTVLWTTAQARWTAATRAQRTTVLLGLLAGLAALLFTRSLLVLLVVSALVIIVPALLSTPVNRDIQILQALDRWVRLLVGSASTGKSLPDAIRATREQVAPLLQGSVDELIVRLDARWSTEAALRAMADDFATPDADAVIAAMIVATNRGGTGSSAALRGLGEHTRHRLQSLRETETERAKPRVVVRQVTLITLAVLTGVAVLNPEYLAPYRSPLGQLLGLALFAGYLGSLLMLRTVAKPRRRERILRGAFDPVPQEVADDV